MQPIRFAVPRRLLASMAALMTLTFAVRAEADFEELDACGGLLLESNASCEVYSTETCTTQCVPVAMEETCAYRLTSTCTPSCTATAAVDCQSSCETTCVPSCTSMPVDQPPNCMGLCMSDCQQDCNVVCADSTEPHCRASCAHTCSRDCRSECDTTTTTDCTPLCTTACAGSCAGRATIDCQVSCQAASFASCETQAVSDCRTDCDTTGGGIYCDGQFCATGDLQACADQLWSELDLSVDLSITGRIDAQADVRGMCAIDWRNGRANATQFGAIALLFGLVVLRTIKRRRGVRADRPSVPDR